MNKAIPRICLFVCLITYIAACNSSISKDNRIVIEGNIKNIPNGKVYLADGYSWKVIDSANCENGRFQFLLSVDSSFTTKMVAIQYKPKIIAGNREKYVMQEGYRRPFFRNHMRGIDSLKYYNATFILERKNMKIYGDAKGMGSLRVIGSRETDIMYSLQMQDFGWIENITGSQRLARLRFFRDKIKATPFSYYLIGEIYKGKEGFSEQELRDFLALFDQNIQHSIIGDKINSYLASRANASQTHPNFTLLGSNKQKEWILDKNAKVNMLVFWASWCGPCRKEIPQLKELYKSYSGRGLNLVSISIDEKPTNWQKALTQEQMQWRQYIVENSQVELIEQQFNFSAIPYMVLLDNQGKEIIKLVGYDENNKNKYNVLLEKKLDKKH